MPNLKRNIAIAVVLCAGLAPRALAEEAPPLPGELGVAADHHLHLRSALGRDAMVAANELLGEELRVDGIDADRPILLARDIVRELDAAGIRKGTVLSEAYLAGMPELVAVHDDAEARTRALNDLTFDEVRQFPARLVGFCSVNPLLEFAADRELADYFEACVALAKDTKT